MYIYILIHSKVFQCYVLCVKRNFEGFGQMMGFGEVTARIPRRLLSICGRPGSKSSLSLFLHLGMCQRRTKWSRNQKRFWCSFFCCFTKSLVTSRRKQMEGLFCHRATTFHLCFHLKGHWLSVPWIEGGFGATVLMIFDIRWWNMLWTGPRGELAKHINSSGFYGFHHLIPLSAKAVMTYSTLNETPLPRNKHVSTLS